MNCLECRRELLVDPRNEAVDLISHINHCQPCSNERAQLLALENTLENSFDYNVPAGLENRVLNACSEESNSKPSRSRRFTGHAWQMAAGIVLAIGLVVYLGINQHYPMNNAYALEVTVLNHINDELHQLHTSEDISGDKLVNIMTAINTQANKDIGSIKYARNCQIRKNIGAHLVTSGEIGPVTILVMPGEHIDKNVHITTGRFEGAIYSTDYGSLAVVGEKGEHIPPIANKMLQGITPVNG